ncbi:MAG: DUF6798 domain-containing protein [Polyangiales bacterium]
MSATTTQTAPAESSLQALLRRAKPSALHLTLFALAACAFALHQPLGGNEASTLMGARRFVDPNYIAGDWFLGLPQGPRAPFQWLISPLVATFHMVTLSLVGRLIGYWALSAGIARLLSRFELRVGEALIFAAAFVRYDQALFAGEWLFGQFESKVIAYALILYAVDAAADLKLSRAAVFLGLATTLHALVGGWATFALALAILSMRPALSRETVVKSGLSWLAAAAPGIFLVAESAGSVRSQSPDVAWIYVDLRNPHHLLPTTWHLSRSSVVIMVVLLPGLLNIHRLWPKRDDVKLTARFVLAALVPCVAGLGVAYLSSHHTFLATYPFRIGGTLLLLLGLPLVGLPLLRAVPPRLGLALQVVALLLVLRSTARSVRSDVAGMRATPLGGHDVASPEVTSFDAACAWLRAQPERDLLLVSPAHQAASYLTERPVVVTFKDIPSGATSAVAWYQRMLEMSGNAPFEARGYELATEVDRRFESLSIPNYCRLAEQYAAHWLLVRRQDLTPTPQHIEGNWRIYDIGPLCRAVEAKT